MPDAFRFGDSSTGHCYPPRNINQSATNVKVNNKGAIRATQDNFAHVHKCGKSVHYMGPPSKGSKTVFVNNKPMVRTGDPVTCGDFCSKGSTNVQVGG